MSKEIMEEYDHQIELYGSLTHKLTSLIVDLLRDKEIQVHSINSRLKDRESLRKKIGRVGDKYSRLDDITDICGIRIITYFENDVDKVAKVIENEFTIDQDNSIDKRASLDPDRFGYLSLHYVCSFPASRIRLTEYKRFQACSFEIQIRSILQHAWAEIEHDLGYKSKLSVPKEVRRRFSRLAGLLEIADSEFAQLRDKLIKYEKDVFEKINNEPELVLIDLISLKAFISQDNRVRELDNVIATASNRVFREKEYNLNTLVKLFDKIGLRTIADINLQLDKYRRRLVSFSKSYIEELLQREWEYDKWVEAGTSLMYLCHLFVAEEGSEQQVSRYLKDNFNMGTKSVGIFSPAILAASNKTKLSSSKKKVVRHRSVKSK